MPAPDPARSSECDLRAELDALRRRVEAAEAALALHTLKATYGELVDRRYAAGAVLPAPALDRVVGDICDLFTEEATWDGGPTLGVARGREAIARRLRTPTIVFSRHLFVKPRLTVTGRTARARWDLLCPCRTADGRSWWMCGYEDDEYACDGGVWRHSSMTLTTVFMAPNGEGFDRILA